ncbi:MAG TPA: hypothetical protein VIL11_03470 [Limnochordales bacterium]
MRWIARLAAATLLLSVAAWPAALAATPKATAPAAARPATFSVTGRLVAVSPEQVTLQAAKWPAALKAFVHKGQLVVKLTKDTVARMGKQTVTVDKLAQGQTVRVAGRLPKAAGGDLVAQTVTVLAAK